MSGPPLTTDAMAVRVMAWFRLLAAVTTAAVGSILVHPGTRLSAFLLVVALVWLPFSAVVLLLSDDVQRPLVRYGGPVGDILVIMAAHALVPASSRIPLLAYAFVIAFVAYSEGRRVAAPLAATSLGLTWVVESHVPGVDGPGADSLGAFAAITVALVVLFDRAAQSRYDALRLSERSESKAAAILSQVAGAVILTDGTGTVTQANPAAGRVFGCAPDEMVGRRCTDVFGLHDGERLLECGRGCQLGNEDREVWRVADDGRRQPLLASASVLTGADGAVVEVVHSMRDVTKIKQADEAKTLFLATTSHELRTPLTVISGFAELLRSMDDPEPTMRRAALDAIYSRAQELAGIVDRLMLSSRIEAGRTRVNLVEVELGRLLAERVKALVTTTQRRIVMDDAECPTVHGDPSALVTVVDHLLENAIKYSPGGEPVFLTARAVGAVAEVTVADEGVGMDAEQAERCFDKFWQAESSDVRRFGGTGIGLYIVRSLVEAMDGQISLRSALGAGSTFRFTVPLVRPLELPEEVVDLELEREPSIIREFMRQIGVPEAGRTS